MNVHRFIILSFIFLVLSAGCSSLNKDNKSSEVPIETLTGSSALLTKLNKKFMGKCPKIIHVVHATGSTSQFHPPTSTIRIDQHSFKNNYETVVAHETSHLCLVNLTNGLSNTEGHRFYDEGLASIIGAENGNNIEAFKKRSLVVAAKKAKKNEVAFSKVQKWRTYFGDPPDADWNAYLVGSSFIFFLIDHYGENKLPKFFSEVGNNKNWETAIQKTFGISSLDLEEKWLDYLREVKIPAPPKVLKLEPANGSQDVATRIAEVLITFDKPMARIVSVGTNCSKGICYTNAHWKNDKTLAIKIDGNLHRDTEYAISLGTEHGLLQSAEGMDLPLTIWKFRTAK